MCGHLTAAPSSWRRRAIFVTDANAEAGLNLMCRVTPDPIFPRFVVWPIAVANVKSEGPTQSQTQSMSENFEELDFQQTEMGELILRRRRLISLGGIGVFEIKLGDSFLMSSLFTKAEIALAELALSELAPGSFDVVVGGLGLGYTAGAALKNPNVKS